MLRRRAAIFGLVYAVAVLYLSLYPWNFQPFPHSSELFWFPLTDRRVILDSVVNVLFYLPFGAAAALLFESSALGLASAVTLGFCLSLAVESAQRYIPMRVGDLTDLFTNTVGAAAGACAVLLFIRRARPSRDRGLARNLFSDAAILGVLWLAWNAFRILTAINHVSFPLSSLCFEFGNAFLGVLTLGIALRKHPAFVAVLALAPLFALFFDPFPAAPIMGGALLGAGVARWIRGNARPVLYAVCLLWLAFQELYPFEWSSRTARFSWLPFEALFSTRPQIYYTILFGKLFFYTVAIWAAHYKPPNSRRVWYPFLILGGGEFVQRFIPGRTPEITDLILMGAGAFLLWIAEPAAWLSPGG
jgi:glycopeptide antibiotics resistance protein